MDPISLGICVSSFIVGYAASKYINGGAVQSTAKPDVSEKKAPTIQDEIRNFDKSKLKRMRNVRPCQKPIQESPAFIRAKREELDNSVIFQALMARRNKLRT